MAARRFLSRSIMLTLPDYLQERLDIVFVGINPGWSSAQAGQYYKTPRNRFWPAFNAATLAPVPFGPETGAACLEHGIGFTDVVKRATRQMSELRSADFREGARQLREKLHRYQPLVICFNGLSGYNRYVKYAIGEAAQASAGRQDMIIGSSAVYVIPSTSPANAAVSLDALTEALLGLKALVRELRDGHG